MLWWQHSRCQSFMEEHNMSSQFTKYAFNLLLAGSVTMLLASTPAVSLAQEPQKSDVVQQVNINMADEQIIADVLVGVGAAKAKAIVQFREEHGPFTSIDQLLEVNGIGESTLTTNRDRIKLE